MSVTTNTVEMVSDWSRDDCYDPCHRVATVRYDGELYVAHRTFPEDGWPFTVRPARYDGRSWTVRNLAEFPSMLGKFPQS